MAKTLEEILNGTEKGVSLRDTLVQLSESLKKEDEDRRANLSPEIARFNENHGVLVDLIATLKERIDVMDTVIQKLDAIISKPDPVFPEPEKFPTEIAVSKPDWYKEPQEIDPEAIINVVHERLKPRFDALEQKNNKEHTITRGALAEMFSAEPAQPIDEKGGKKNRKLWSPGGAIRKGAKWEVSTFPNIAGTGTITSAGDNQTYYLPNALIPNSDHVKLNGGDAMGYGQDYTLTGNKLFFTQVQNQPLIEVRGQTQ